MLIITTKDARRPPSTAKGSLSQDQIPVPAAALEAAGFASPLLGIDDGWCTVPAEADNLEVSSTALSDGVLDNVVALGGMAADAGSRPLNRLDSARRSFFIVLRTAASSLSTAASSGDLMSGE